MKQSTRTRRAAWKDAFLGPGLGAGVGTLIGFAIELYVHGPSLGGFGATIGSSFFSLPALGAAIGGAIGALWMQTRPRVKRLKKSHQEKDSS